MRQDLHSAVSMRQGGESRLKSAEARAGKAEAELSALQQAGVNADLQLMRAQAELTQLRDNHKYAGSMLLRPRPFCASDYASRCEATAPL